MERIRYQGRTPFNLDQYRRFTQGIEPSGAYYERLAACGRLSQGTYGWQHRCWLPPCPCCRSIQHSREWKRTRDAFGDGSALNTSMMSVVLGTAASLEDAEDLISKGRWQARNLIDAWRRRCRSSKSLRLRMWLEMDAVHPEDLPRIGSQRADLLAALGSSACLERGPIWVPTFHGLVYHPDLGRAEVSSAFRRTWSLPNQLDVRPLRQHLTYDQNIQNVVAYSLKHRCTSVAGGTSTPWPVEWMVEYYGWLHVWSRGFRKIRFVIGPKRERHVPLQTKHIVEPMPVVL